MRRAAGFFVVAALLGGCGDGERNSARPAARASKLIEPGHAIAGVRLDDSKEDVRDVFGEPDQVLDESDATEPSKFDEAWGYRGERLSINFLRGKVGLISTARKGDRTPSGVGVGSTRSQVKRALRHLGVYCPEVRVCRLGPEGEVVTDFIFSGGRVTVVYTGRIVDVR